MMDDEGFFVSVWRDLRAPEPNLVVRLALSVVTWLVLAAASVGGAWMWAYAQNGPRYGVRDEEIGVASAVGTLCWFAALIGIWRPMRRGRQFVLPAILTLAVGFGVIAGGIAIDEFTTARDEELLILGLVFLGTAALILIWLPTVLRLLRGRPVVGADKLVRVRCPECGYSLIGLRDLRCPECGTRFTIDELIRAQNYGGLPKLSADDPEEPKPPRLRREHPSEERETG